MRFNFSEELVGNDECGIVLPNNDVTSLTKALKSFALDFSNRRKTGEVAYERTSHYAWCEIAKEYLNMFAAIQHDNTVARKNT